MPQRDPVEPLKQQLAGELVLALKSWRPTEIYFRLRLDQPRVWELRHGKLARFSLQRLVRLLDDMKYDVSVSVTKRTLVRLRSKEGVSRQ